MNTSYIYSSSRIKTIEGELFNETDLEKVLTANRGNDLVKALKETAFSEYITGDEISTISEALEKNILVNKKLLTEIVPEPEMFDFIWIRYDIHNLRTILRAKRLKLDFPQISKSLSFLGKYEPERIWNGVGNGTLGDLEPEFKTVYEQAVKILDERGISSADMVLDFGYFSIMQRLAEKTNNQLIKDLVKLQIDLHNLKTRSRLLRLDIADEGKYFVLGGNFSFSEIETKEQFASKFLSLSGEQFWRQALDSYENEGYSTLLDARMDDYILHWVQQYESEVFSFKTLLVYLLKCQSFVKNIQAIVVGKESGQNESVIRQQLRNIYV